VAPTSASGATSASAAVIALGVRGRNINQARPQRHWQSRDSHDGQNGNPTPLSHPFLLQNIDLQAGHLIAAQAQVALALWRQTSTLRKECEKCAG
jgi:hypothetical protein